jgi:hypothetical protein
MRSPKKLSQATKELRMKEHTSHDSLDQTIEACSWLIDIAQQSVNLYGWSDEIVRYLERLGQAAYEAKARQLGGMGAVAPMVTH